MTMQKKIDSYDEIKGMLNIMRKLNRSSLSSIREQMEGGLQNPAQNITQNMPQNPTQNTAQKPTNQGTGNEKKDFIVVNNVEIVFHSTDQMDLQLSDEEKAKISQLIDDFRTEVGSMVNFGKLNFYNENAKLDGTFGNINMGFILSAGDDTGVFLANASLLKLDDEVMGYIQKLKIFGEKFVSVINELIVTRKDN